MRSANFFNTRRGTEAHREIDAWRVRGTARVNAAVPRYSRSAALTLAALSAGMLALGCADAPSAVPEPKDAAASTMEVDRSAPCPACPCLTCYKILELGTLPGGFTSEALGINDSSVVVGWSTVPSGGQLVDHAFRYYAQVMTDLGTLPGDDHSRAYDVNNAGQIVGESWKGGTGVVRSFIWTLGQGMQDLGNLGGTNYTSARGINEAGSVGGESEKATGAARAFRWTSGGGMQGTAGYSSRGYDISDSGWVVGVRTSNNHAYRWRKPPRVAVWVGTDLGTLGGCCSVAFGVNNKGVVVGRSHNAQGGNRAFRWTANDGMTALTTVASQAWDISSRDRVVGEGSQGPGQSQWSAFTLRPSHPAGNLVFLTGLPSNGRETAYAVNKCGTIAGRASTGQNPFDYHAVIWTRSVCDP